MIYTDQIKREIRLDKPPSRIISLVPSLTELLYDLGLNEAIAGITKFCIHPDTIYRNVAHVGGTKKINHQKIDQIHPDIIIANKEENTKADIDILEKKYPVWVSDINTLEDALCMIEMIGAITGKQAEANQINNNIKIQFKRISPLPPTRTLYLIWRKPFMVAGKDTFIDDLMKRCGFENAAGQQARYPAVDENDIRQLNPELILLSSEPYPFKQKHTSEIKEIVPGCRVELVDGAYFSWYGSRLAGSPEYFNILLNKLKNSNPEAALYEN